MEWKAGLVLFVGELSRDWGRQCAYIRYYWELCHVTPQGLLSHHITYVRTISEGSGSSKSGDRSIILDPWPT